MDWKTRRKIEQERELRAKDKRICEFCGGFQVHAVNADNPVRESGYHDKCLVNAVRLERANK